MYHFLNQSLEPYVVTYDPQLFINRLHSIDVSTIDSNDHANLFCSTDQFN